MKTLKEGLVAFESRDKIRLTGILAPATENLATVIHVHGSCGNFCENSFIHVMQRAYPRRGINFLAFNNRGHDCIAEAYKNGTLIYVGGAIEDFEECILDIDGALCFAEKLGAPVFLQGHSLGCAKVIFHLMARKISLPCILLSPSDPRELQVRYIAPEALDSQIRRVKLYDRRDDLLPKHEFGVRQQGADYYIPVSAGTFLSLFEGEAGKVLDYNGSYLYCLDVDAFVYYGGIDPLWTASPEVVRDFFSCRTRSLKFYLCLNGDHHFRGIESKVLSRIIDWILGGRHFTSRSGAPVWE
jgi:hypothetical protein